MASIGQQLPVIIDTKLFFDTNEFLGARHILGTVTIKQPSVLVFIDP